MSAWRPTPRGGSRHVADNAAVIVAIELMAAAQGVELRKPLETSPRLREAMNAIRARAAFLDEDRYIAPEMEAVTQLVLSGWFRGLVRDSA